MLTTMTMFLESGGRAVIYIVPVVVAYILICGVGRIMVNFVILSIVVSNVEVTVPIL